MDGEAWWATVHGVAKGQCTTDEYVQSNMLAFLLQQTYYKGLIFTPGEQSGGWKFGGQEEMHFIIYPEERIQSQLRRRKSELPHRVCALPLCEHRLGFRGQQQSTSVYSSGTS